MVRGKNTKGLVILLLLLLTSTLNASLIRNIKGDSNGINIDPEWTSKNGYRVNKSIVTGPYKSGLSAIYPKYNNRTVNLSGNSRINNQARSLPHVPRAIIMAVFGFVCVSIIKDRRVWLRTLSGIIWAGQSSLSLLPYIAFRFVSQKQIRGKSTDLYDESYEHRKEWDLQKNSKDERYIGLLRRLAGIPQHIKENKIISEKYNSYSILNNYYCPSCNQKQNCNSLKSDRFKDASQLFVSLIKNKSTAFKKKHKNSIFIIIFACLARGPPIRKWEQKLSFKRRVNAQNPSD